MSHWRLGMVAAGLLLVMLLTQHVLVTMPALSRAGDVLTVGDPPRDFARFKVGDDVEIKAASLGYEMGLTGGVALSNYGPRAILSYIDPALYEAARQQAKCNGGCLAGPLNAYQSQGRIGHLLLIPANTVALSTMKKTQGATGQNFRLSGHWLKIDYAEFDGCDAIPQLDRTTSFFLVDSLADAK